MGWALFGMSISSLHSDTSEAYLPGWNALVVQKPLPDHSSFSTVQRHNHTTPEVCKASNKGTNAYLRYPQTPELPLHPLSESFPSLEIPAPRGRLARQKPRHTKPRSEVSVRFGRPKHTFSANATRICRISSPRLGAGILRIATYASLARSNERFVSSGVAFT